MGNNMSTLRQQLAEVMGIVGYVQKDGKNAAQSYKYASAEAVLKKVNAELSKRCIAISSEAVVEHFNVTQYETTGKDRSGNEFTKQNFRSDAVVKLALTFHGENDESLTVEGIGQSTDLGDKAVMKANTAAIKYCLTNAFLISWGDDPEADSAGDPPKDRPAPKKKTGSTGAPVETSKTGFKKPEKF